MSGGRVVRLEAKRLLAWCYALPAVAAVIALSVLVPPFQNSDELNHVDRADQLSRGVLLAGRVPGKPGIGGIVDVGPRSATSSFEPLRFHPERKVTRAMRLLGDGVRWDATDYQDFSNTAVYPPAGYLPAALAIAIGRWTDQKVTDTLRVARALGGILDVALATAALAIAGESAEYLMVILALPMTLSLFAAVSQDGLMIAGAALAVALLDRLSRTSPERRSWGLVLLGASLLLANVGRPPYAVLGLLPLLMPSGGFRGRVLVVTAVVLGVGGWAFATLSVGTPGLDPSRHVDPPRQLRWLVAAPLRAVSVVWDTMDGPQGMEQLPFYQEVVGVLGSIDVRLPLWSYWFAGLVLASAIVRQSGRRTPMAAPRAQGLAAFLLLLATFCVFVALDLTWTPVGNRTVLGVQGRYFIPILLFVPSSVPACAALRRFRDSSRVSLMIAASPSVFAVVAVAAVWCRYW